MTTVFPRRDLRRSGSLLKTCGLGEELAVSRVDKDKTHHIFWRNGVMPSTPII